MRNVIVGLGLSCALSIVSSAGCGGGTASGAALQVSIHPGDRGVVNGRRLESLARQFEQQYPCTAADTISIQGVAPQTYSAEGCGHMVVYQLQCRPGVYGQICDWGPIVEDLMARAAVDMSCRADAMDMQPAQGMGRSVMGCGYAATYILQCQGMCSWQLASPVAQVGPMTGGGNGAATGGNSAYITQ
ncbi:MAG: hypothetical protein ACK6CU_12250 [Deltaproteobacteria bacterium]|jgi:hypothetical protein